MTGRLPSGKDGGPMAEREAPLSRTGVWITRIVLLLIVLAIAYFLLLK